MGPLLFIFEIQHSKGHKVRAHVDAGREMVLYKSILSGHEQGPGHV